MEQVAVKVYTEAEKRRCLESSLYNLTNVNSFYGNLLQTVNIRYNQIVPTAAITYNQKEDRYEVYLNPNFFCELTLTERVAVLQHEVLHFTNKHLFRLPFLGATPEDRMLYNVAGDMAINQLITGLPKDCIDYKKWKMKDGSVFPALQSMEQYYELIKDNKEANKDKFQGGCNGQCEKGKDKQAGGTGEGKKCDCPCGGSQTLDDHSIWEGMSEEDKQKMLEEAKRVIKRTIEKSSNSYTKTPQEVEDLLQEIDHQLYKLNYKRILKQAIKRTVSCQDREHTWNRKNKRFGSYAPGSRMGSLPRLNFYIDTSGSISIREMNEFLTIMEKFLKVGVRECTLGLWHTSLYYKKKHKLGNKLKQDVVQSGGTLVESALEDIDNTNPNLSIILTDGHFEQSDVKPSGEVIFIISNGGNENHPMKNIGKTIPLSKLA